MTLPSSPTEIEMEISGPHELGRWLLSWGRGYHCWVDSEEEAHRRGLLIRREPVVRAVIEATVPDDEEYMLCVSGCAHLDPAERWPADPRPEPTR